jgi:predicted regulator of Ras-like GTPase activity (Roadblock/LC7/MglB family)
VDEGLGLLRGISLTTVLQVVQLDRVTCTVTVDGDGRSGKLHFHDGELIDAETAELSGTEAAYEIVQWRDANVELAALEATRPRAIEQPLTAILLDVSRMIDEGRGGAGLDGQKEGSMNRLQKLLDDFRDEVPEFVSTDVVNTESGLSIGGGSVDPSFDASVAAACSAEVVKSNRRALELLGLGADSTEDILISTRKVYLLIRMLGKEYYHVLAVSRKGNLGLARAIMKKHEPRLLAAVGELA